MILLLLQAMAQPTEADLDRAMELYDNGQALYAEGNYEDAIAAWQRSFELSGRIALMFNLANAQERLGRYEEAIESLNRYRAFATGVERQQLDLRVRNLVRLADERRAAQPRPEPAEEPEAVDGPASAELVPVPAPVEEPEPVLEPLPAPLAPVEPVPSELVATTHRNPQRWRPLVGGTLIGIGVAAWGSAIGTGLGFRSARDQVSTLCVNLEQGVTCPVEAEGALTNQTRLAYATDALLLLGGAAIGAGVGLAFGTRTEVTLAPNELVVRGRF